MPADQLLLCDDKDSYVKVFTEAVLINSKKQKEIQ